MKSIFIKTLALTLSIVMLISLALFGFESYANENALSAPINSETSSSDKGNTNNASNHLTVFANGEYKVNFICSATATDLDKSVCNQLCLLFSKATGVMPTVKTDAARISGPAILIGKTTNEKSTELYSSVSTNQAKAALSKDFYAIAYANEESFLELYERLRALISRQLEGNALVIDSNWNLSLRHVNTAKASISLPNKVIAFDQRYQQAVIYNLNNYSAGKTLDDLEESSFTVGPGAGIKYRENTVFGNVVIIAGPESGIYTTSGSKKWSTTNPGYSPHSIEILPSGNLVIASSSDNKLRFFKTSALINNGSVSYEDYTIADAHGVLWDPTYGVLWAIGNTELNAYRIKGNGTGEKLVLDPNMSITLPEYFRGGHDLSPDYLNTRYLYASLGYKVVKVDKETGQMRTLFEKTPTSVKGFSNNTAGNFFVTGETGGAGKAWANESYQSWCTDTIYFCRYKADDTLEQIPIKSSKRAFYKSRAYCGTYQ